MPSEIEWKLKIIIRLHDTLGNCKTIFIFDY